MRVDGLTRRRALTLVAAASACAAHPQRARAAADYEWRGTAMGAPARLVFNQVSHADAEAAVAATLDEIERLEQALSLFRENSELWRLNREGVLFSPSSALRDAVQLALTVADATSGLFDPTVQALWQAHVDWFAAQSDAGLPPLAVVDAARACTDWRKIVFESNAIRLGQGQRLTLNGLGQGYVTDRVADLLRSRGFTHIFIDLGEQRVLGPRRDGAAWLVERYGASAIPLREGALATSEGAGCVLGANGAAHHLFEPHTGRSAHHWRSMTVHHRSAAVADAFSTALYVGSAQQIERIVKKVPGLRVWATDDAGHEVRWASRSA